MYNKTDFLQQVSDHNDESFMLELDKVHKFLYERFDGNARCMAEVGCVEKTVSAEELDALKIFYQKLEGANWRFKHNWLEGDPCTNQWYGVGCNTEGQVISLHFFENHMIGEFDDSIS